MDATSLSTTRTSPNITGHCADCSSRASSHLRSNRETCNIGPGATKVNSKFTPGSQKSKAVACGPRRYRAPARFLPRADEAVVLLRQPLGWTMQAPIARERTAAYANGFTTASIDPSACRVRPNGVLRGLANPLRHLGSMPSECPCETFVPRPADRRVGGLAKRRSIQ